MQELEKNSVYNDQKSSQIKEGELESLLSLYEYLIPDDPKLKIDASLKNTGTKYYPIPTIFIL